MATDEHTLSPESAKHLGFQEQVKLFGRAFWSANVMEIIERWAYYGVRAVLSLYIVDAVAHGGLEFTHLQKGSIYALWALVQSLLPMFTGGYADRFGFKKTIAVAIAIKIGGYLLMATQHTYGGFLTGCLLLATGTAIFKPGIGGIIAHATTPRNASVGWGIFYAMVNIGGFVGPWAAGYLRMMSWSYVFYANAALVALNFFMLLTFKEPERPAPSAPPAESPDERMRPSFPRPLLLSFFGSCLLFFLSITLKLPIQAPFIAYLGMVVTGGLLLLRYLPAGGIAFVREFFEILFASVKNLFEPQLISFILIFSGFWLMFMQLFDLLPNYIDDWVDSSGVLLWMGHAFGSETLVRQGLAGQQIPPEWMINLDAGAIVLLMVPIAALLSHWRPLRSIIWGIVVSIVGIIVAGATANGAWCLLGIFVFAVGEMMASPKKLEYLASIAPPEKRGLYLGYANVPLAIGWGIGSTIGGNLYQTYADKVTLAKAYMASQLHMSPEAINAIPKQNVMDTLAAHLHTTPHGATRMLFALHHPDRIWYVFAAIGCASMIGMIFYDAILHRQSKIGQSSTVL